MIRHLSDSEEEAAQEIGHAIYENHVAKEKQRIAEDDVMLAAKLDMGQQCRSSLLIAVLGFMICFGLALFIGDFWKFIGAGLIQLPITPVVSVLILIDWRLQFAAVKIKKKRERTVFNRAQGRSDSE